MRALRSQLTYANVVATLALFLALGGVGYAAVVVTGKNVKDGSLTGKDVRDGSLRTADLAKGAAFLITMGCGESCPYVPGVPILDWPLPDPRGQGIEPVRLIRDEVESRVRSLVQEHGWA